MRRKQVRERDAKLVDEAEKASHIRDILAWREVLNALQLLGIRVDAVLVDDMTSVETSVSITNERSVPLTSKLSSELTSFIDVANMFF